MVIITVLFFQRAMFDKYCTIMNEVSESSPEVGSSKMMTCGSLMSQKAIEVLFLSPPEIPLMSWPPTITSRQFQSLSCLLSFIIFQFFYYKEQSSLRLAAKVRVSLTVRVDINTSVCMTQLAKLPKSQQLQGLLLAHRCPPFWRSILHAMMLSREVLPAPEEPMMEVRCPLLHMPDTLSSITLSLYLRLKGRLRPSDLISTLTEQLIFLKAMSMPWSTCLWKAVSVCMIMVVFVQQVGQLERQGERDRKNQNYFNENLLFLVECPPLGVVSTD